MVLIFSIFSDSIMAVYTFAAVAQAAAWKKQFCSFVTLRGAKFNATNRVDMHTKLYGPLPELEKTVAFIAQAGIGI